MRQQQALSQWTQGGAHHLPHLSTPQAVVLAAFRLGLALARRWTLSVVAEAVAGLGKPDPVERRLQRVLSTPRVAWQPRMEALAAWVLTRVAPTAVIVLRVDATSLGAQLKVMVVSLASRGRALPLAWWCYRHAVWPLPPVAVITALRQRVAPHIPAGAPVLVQADRGLGPVQRCSRPSPPWGGRPWCVCRGPCACGSTMDARSPLPTWCPDRASAGGAGSMPSRKPGGCGVGRSGCGAAHPRRPGCG